MFQGKLNFIIIIMSSFFLHIQLPLLTGDLIEEQSNLNDVREAVEMSTVTKIGFEPITCETVMHFAPPSELSTSGRLAK